jgi:transposase
MSLFRKKRRAEIAKEIKDGGSDKLIAKKLGVPPSSVYVVRMKPGPDGRYSSGRPRTVEELELIIKEGGLTP